MTWVINGLVMKSQTWLSDFTFIFHFYALEKEMATHSSVLAWRIPGMGPHRVGHDWSDLAVVAAVSITTLEVTSSAQFSPLILKYLTKESLLPGEHF